MSTPTPDDDGRPRTDPQPPTDPFAQGPYAQDRHQPGAGPQRGKRSTVKTVIAVVLLVIGALATLLALLTTLGFVAEIGDTAAPANLVGQLVGAWLVVLIFVVPGLLLLRRPKR